MQLDTAKSTSDIPQILSATAVRLAEHAATATSTLLRQTGLSLTIGELNPAQFSRHQLLGIGIASEIRLLNSLGVTSNLPLPVEVLCVAFFHESEPEVEEILKRLSISLIALHCQHLIWPDNRGVQSPLLALRGAVAEDLYDVIADYLIENVAD